MGRDLLKVGCSGFCISKKDYFSRYKVVEVQLTFYKVPSFNLLKKWREEAPDDFDFVIKVSQGITHPPSSPTYRKFNMEVKDPERYGLFRNTEEVFNLWRLQTEIADILNARSFLFQTPARFGKEEDFENMINFFKSIERKEYLFFYEWRHKDHEKALEICEICNLIPVSLPFDRVFPGEFIYMRLHGGKGYRHRYTDEELLRLKDMVKNKKGYVFFNNIFSKEDSLRFIQILNG